MYEKMQRDLTQCDVVRYDTTSSEGKDVTRDVEKRAEGESVQEEKGCLMIRNRGQQAQQRNTSKALHLNSVTDKIINMIRVVRQDKHANSTGV